MSPKYRLLLTFILFIAQCCLGNVIPSNEDTQSAESSEFEKKIEAFFLGETTKFTVEHLTLGRNIAKKLLSKLETAEHVNETLEAEMEKLSDYIRKVDYLLAADAERVKAAEEDEVDAVYEETFHIASESPNSSLGDVLKLMLLSVKHIQDFSDDINDVWNALSTEQQSEGKEFGAWLQQLKKESLENKFQMFAEITQLDTDEEQSTPNSSDDESNLKTNLQILQSKEAYKFSEILLDSLKDVFSYVHQDWWVVRDTNVKAESRAQQIAQIALLLDDLTQLNPSSISDKVNFLLKWLDFLSEESVKELLVRTLRHRNLDPHEFVQKKFTPYFNELSEALSEYWNSLNPQQQSKLTNFTSWLQKFKEETDVIKKAKLFSQLEDVL